jgi:uncharacterized radical SAM superfamily Fe-S cluster-containing enzyme
MTTEVATPEALAPAPKSYDKTRNRVITKRAVMWLGQTCNLRCYFCYFLNRIDDAHHEEHPFMSIEKAKAMCTTFREFYGCTSIDIQGGEPTIYPHILELIRHCRDIGLYPTLITNGLRLAKPGQLEKFQEAGIRDFSSASTASATSTTKSSAKGLLREDHRRHRRHGPRRDSLPVQLHHVETGHPDPAGYRAESH